MRITSWCGATPLSSQGAVYSVRVATVKNKFHKRCAGTSQLHFIPQAPLPSLSFFLSAPSPPHPSCHPPLFKTSSDGPSRRRRQRFRAGQSRG